jgi:hypothetical protein
MDWLFRNGRWRALPLAAIAGVLVAHSLAYGFVTDDAYISFVYSRNLAEHGELTFNLGERVEGYTNFLWTVLLGLLMTVGLPPELTSLVLGTAFAAATLVVVFAVSREAFEGEPSSWALVAPALLSLTAGYACWSSGGLETQMFTFWVALSVYAAVRGDAGGPWLRRLGVFLALAALTRPEGLLVAGCIGLHRLIFNLGIERRLAPRRDEWIAMAWFLGLLVPWLAWRWWYYGHPLPNTYYVKAAGAASAGYAERLREVGLYYVWQWARQSHALWAAPLAAVALVARPRSARFRFATLAALIAVLYLLYAVRVGGDFMGLHRFVMPVTVLVATLAAVGLRRIAVAAGPWRWGAAGVAALAAALVLAHGAGQLRLTARATAPENLASDHGIDTPAYLALYARDRARIGRHMRECFEPDDFSIFGGVGAKPYYAEAEGIDVFGLVSERIAHEVPRTHARPGHNKWGPDSLLASRDPDLVFSCYSLHRDAARPQWNCNPSFWRRRGYEAITLHIPGLRERGEYYTFLAKKERRFECPGMIEGGERRR